MTENVGYHLTPEDLAMRTQGMKDFLKMLFEARTKGETTLDTDLGRIEGSETGVALMELGQNILVTFYGIALDLGIKRDDIRNLSSEEDWQRVCDNPAREADFFANS